MKLIMKKTYITPDLACVTLMNEDILTSSVTNVDILLEAPEDWFNAQ